MTRVYQSCKDERGTGCYMRMKNIMKSHLEGNSGEMFEEVRTDMRSALLKTMENVQDVAFRELEASCSSFNRY